MANRSKSPATRAKRKIRTLAFPVEFRLRIVKLFLEEGYSARLLVEQFGISTHSVQRWVRAYRLHGEAGLEPKVPAGRISRVAEEVRQQAVAVKAEHPEYGPRRITRCSQALLSDAHQPGDGSQDTLRAGAGEEAPRQGGEEPSQAALLRARPTQPALAERHT